MALATRCPHCETAFRVASDQLKLRAGLVRCGTCNQIFNGIENLLHPDEDIPAALAASVVAPSDALLLAPVDETPPAETAVQKSPATPADAFVGPLPAVWPALESRNPGTAPTAAGTYAGTGAETTAGTEPAAGRALWIALADASSGVEPAATQARPDADTAQPDDDDVISPEGPVKKAADVRDDATDRPADDGAHPRPSDGLSRPDAIPSMAGLLRAAGADDGGVLTTAPRMRVPAQQPKAKLATDVKAAPEIADLPDFVVRDQKKQDRYRAWHPVLWGACALLGVVLILQSVYATRTTLAANFPQTRRILDSACNWLGCSVGLPMQIESVSIESSDFQPVDGNRDLFLLTVFLRNRGTTVQGWPCIELTLNDAADKAVGRRVITPREYLPVGQDASKGITTGAEQAVTLYFNLTQIKALGYRVYLFYP